MTRPVVLLMLILPNALWAADDCTFDQDHQREVLSQVAKMNPGAKADPESRQVTWSRSDEGTTTFAYGGCAHLDSIVSRSTPLAAARTQEEIFALARELATRKLEQ